MQSHICYWMLVDHISTRCETQILNNQQDLRNLLLQQSLPYLAPIVMYDVSMRFQSLSSSVWSVQKWVLMLRFEFWLPESLLQPYENPSARLTKYASQAVLFSTRPVMIHFYSIPSDCPLRYVLEPYETIWYPAPLYR